VTPCFRLAVRTEATGADTANVVFFLAELATMDGAVELARFPIVVLQSSPGLFDKLLVVFQESLDSFVEEMTGSKPTRWARQEPLEPSEGKA